MKSLASNHISNSGKSFAHKDFRDNSSTIYPILSLLNSSNSKLNIYAKTILLVLYHKTINIKLQLKFRKLFKSSNKSHS